MEQGDGIMGTRLADVIFDRHEDHLYEDSRAMRLTPYVMSERAYRWRYQTSSRITRAVTMTH